MLGFGCNEALRYPDATGELPNAPVGEGGYSLCGTVDHIARQRELNVKTLHTDLIVPWMSAGSAPIGALLRSNELLVENVLPLVGLELSRFPPSLRAEYGGETWRSP